MTEEEKIMEEYAKAFNEDVVEDFTDAFNAMEESVEAFNKELETTNEELGIIEEYINALRGMTPTELEEYKAKIFRDAKGDEALTRFFEKAFSLAE